MKDIINSIDENNNEYSLKIKWESLCTRCSVENCILRDKFPTCDCKNFKLK